MGQPVAEDTALPVSSIVYLEVNEERLFVATEVGPCDIVDGGVGPHFNRYGLGCGTVVHEHLRDLSVNHVGGVVTDVNIFRE